MFYPRSGFESLSQVWLSVSTSVLAPPSRDSRPIQRSEVSAAGQSRRPAALAGILLLRWRIHSQFRQNGRKSDLRSSRLGRK